MAKRPSSDILEDLYGVIVDRRDHGDPKDSYSARLFARGRAKICQKTGEEAVETVVAALSETPAHVTAESADLLYHLLVLWADCGVKPRDVWAELAKREGMSGIEEKRSRAAKTAPPAKAAKNGKNGKS